MGYYRAGGLFSFIKAVGRAVDPTSRTSPLGSIARTAIGFIPGGGSVLGALGIANGIKGALGGRGASAPAQQVASPAYSAPAMATAAAQSNYGTPGANAFASMMGRKAAPSRLRRRPPRRRRGRW